MIDATIICPHCKQSFNPQGLVEKEVGCEECGSHPALECPNCHEFVDLIYNQPELSINLSLQPSTGGPTNGQGQ